METRTRVRRAAVPGPAVERMIRFPADLYEQLAQLARENGWAINTEIMQALKMHVSVNKGEAR